MDAAARQYYESALFAGRYYLALTKRSQRIQADFLARTIEANGDTAFGREHGFAGIRSPAEYQRMVPVRKYDALEAWIERAAAGEGAVLTAETPILFHRTSGTSGAAKKIPVTKSGWLTRYVNSPARWASLLEHHPEINERVDAALSMTISPPAATRTAGGFPWCFFSETNWADARFSRHPGGPGVRAPWATAPAEVADRASTSCGSARRARCAEYWRGFPRPSCTWQTRLARMGRPLSGKYMTGPYAAARLARQTRSEQPSSSVCCRSGRGSR